MLDVQQLKEEALYFRALVESSNKSDSKLLTNEFPVMNCYVASLLLAFHYLQKWIDIDDIVGVYGRTNDDIPHFWLELEGYCIDITGDQYNIIDEEFLSSAIITNRPYPSVHVSLKSQSYLYHLFDRFERTTLKKGFCDFGDDFIEDMEYSYHALQAKCYRN
nr:hypothetical protein [Moritella viscosa]SHO06831.1 Putative uncharacterized protein [Moritella viscosa]